MDIRVRSTKEMLTDTGRFSMLAVVMWLAGVVIALAGVMMTWVDLDATLVDGTDVHLSLSGLDAASSGMAGGFVPYLYLLLALVSLALLVTMYFRRNVMGSYIPHMFFLLSIIVMFVSVNFLADNALYYTDPPFESSSIQTVIPGWVEDLAGGELTYAKVSSGIAYLVCIAGMLVSWLSLSLRGFGAGRSFK